MNKLKIEIEMKKILVTIFALLAIIFSTLTFNTVQAQVKDSGHDPIIVTVFENGKWITYEIDGPGGKIVPLWIEGLE